MTTKENNTMIQWPEIEMRCETHEPKRRILRRSVARVQCNKPALHIVTAKHDEQGCKPTTHAVCKEHGEELIESLQARTIMLAGSLALGLPAFCEHCNTELTELDDAGTLTCLH